MATPGQYVSGLRERDLDSPDALVVGPETRRAYDLSEADLLLVEKKDGEWTWHFRADGRVVTVEEQRYLMGADSVRLGVMGLSAALFSVFAAVSSASPPVLGAVFLTMVLSTAYVYSLPDQTLQFEDKRRKLDVTRTIPEKRFVKSLREYLQELSEAAPEALPLEDDQSARITPKRYDFCHKGAECSMTPALIELVNEALHPDPSLTEQVIRTAKNIGGMIFGQKGGKTIELLKLTITIEAD